MKKIHTVFGDRKTGVLREVNGLCPADDYKSLFPALEKPKQVLFFDQVHGCDIAVIDDLADLPSLQVDAAVTTLSGLALAAKTADCAPVLLSDERAGVIAMAHSGWQGTLNNIIAPTVVAMLAKGADKTRIKAQVGPCLHKNNFAMGGDVYDRFLAAHPFFCNFFTVHPTEKGKYLFDSIGALTWQLRESGVTAIISDKSCTVGEKEKYFSYRQRHQDPQNDSMRNVSAIWIS